MIKQSFACRKHGTKYIREVSLLDRQENSSPRWWVVDGWLCEKCMTEELEREQKTFEQGRLR